MVVEERLLHQRPHRARINAEADIHVLLDLLAVRRRATPMVRVIQLWLVQVVVRVRIRRPLHQHLVEEAGAGPALATLDVLVVLRLPLVKLIYTVRRLLLVHELAILAVLPMFRARSILELAAESLAVLRDNQIDLMLSNSV